MVQVEEKTKAGKDSKKTRARPTIERKEFEQELKMLQIELVKLQEWVKHKGLKVVIVFEGATVLARVASSSESGRRASPVLRTAPALLNLQHRVLWIPGNDSASAPAAGG